MKNTKSLQGIVALAAALFCLPATAQDGPWYFGGTVGAARAKDACTLGEPCRTRTATVGVLGGYEFNRALSLEAGIRDLGEGRVAGSDVNWSAVEIVGLGMIPMGPLAPYIKGGAFRSEASSGFFTDRRYSWTYGAGLQFAFTKNFGMRLEWQRYRSLGGPNVGLTTHIDTAAAVALFRFR